MHYYPGALGNSGVTFALWSWARAQAAAGFEVLVLHAGNVEGGGPEFVSKAQTRGLTAREVPHRGGSRIVRHPVGLGRHLGSRDLLILHEGWVAGNMVAAEAARRARVPYIVMPHGVYDSSWTRFVKPPRQVRDRLERRVLEGAAAVHLFFDREAADVLQIAPRAAFLTVPTGYDVPPERWIGGGDYLAWLGRVDPDHKGLDVLVRAIATLPPDARPVVHIHGYDYKGGVARLNALIGECGVRDVIRLGEPLAKGEKLEFLRHARGYVLPSRWESHSIALLESLALGVPSLVSSWIHIAPELERADAAILAPPEQAALAAALTRLSEQGVALGDRGRQFVADRFPWDSMIASYIAELDRRGLG